MATQVQEGGFLETADFIGAKLSRDAIWSGDRCNWYGVPVSETRRSVVMEAQSVCGADLYSGTSGIAIFLARLFSATGEKVFRITAEGAIRQALSRLDHFPRESRVDFYRGLTGVAYGLFEIAENCGIEKFNDIGLLILEDVASEEIKAADLRRSALNKETLATPQQLHETLRAVRSQIDSTTDTILDFSLAEGLTGAGDLLIEASRILQDEQFRRAAEDIGNRGIAKYRADDLPWPCGSTDGWDAPSLMTGLAGIGYFYLRLHNPSSVPSLLFA